MPTKQEILNEAKRTTKDNGGKPLGVARFERETGIKQHEWGKYWARFGDLLTEAGFSPNLPQGAYPKDFLIEKVIGIVRKFRRFPTHREVIVERSVDPSLPSWTAFKRLGSKDQLIKNVLSYCESKVDAADVVELCKAALDRNSSDGSVESFEGAQTVGEVYLFKSGRYYKIGKTIDTVRRGAEIRIQLPEKMDLIHSIKTDDPTGVESYWHKRFESKRMQGEWFDLKSGDVKAFKRWRRIY
jgi:hypothetical protein